MIGSGGHAKIQCSVILGKFGGWRAGICRHVLIGAGAVVVKDIPDNCKAYGVPAKVIKY